MDKQISVSIIVPVYNVEKYLDNCIESLVKQTKSAVQIILVDDGSMDSSLSIANKWADHYQCIKVLTQKNQGAPAARNYGFSICDSDYVMFFDSDDVLRSDALEKLVLASENGTADIVFGIRKYDLDSDDEEVRKKYSLDNSIISYTSEIASQIFDEDPLPGNKLYRRDFLNENGILFSKLAIGQDLNFYIKSLFLAKKVNFINSIVMDYRVVEGSISRVFKLDKLMAIKESEDDAYQFVKSMLPADDQIERVFNSSRVINYSVQAEKLKKISGFRNSMKGYIFFFRNSRKFLWNQKKLIMSETLKVRRKKLIKYFIFSIYLSIRYRK